MPLETESGIMMYRFNLQPVLDHRQFIEDSLQKELADIKQRVLMACRQLDGLKRKEMKTVEAMQQEQRHGLASDQAIAYHAYLRRIAERIAVQQAAVAQLQASEAQKQAELMEAMKNRQMLETLRDKDLQRHTQTQLKKEMHFIDEIAVNQFARKIVSRHGGGE